MRLSFGQEMRQQQVQKLAPRMIQSMEILQLSLMALQERIEQEMAENPLLEVSDLDPDLPDESVDADNPDAPTMDERELVVDETHNNEDDFERLLNLSDEWPDAFEDRSRPSRNWLEDEGNRRHDAMANMVARPESLQDHLRLQIGELDLEPALRKMAERIIYNLDANGYLQGQIEDLLDPDADPSQVALAREALAVIWQLDPPGVGARDTRECLLLQLHPSMEFYEELKKILSDHLDDVKHNRLPAIERKTGYSIEHIQEILHELRHLNPWPGTVFNRVTAPVVTPDVIVERDEDGQYQVRMEYGDTPSLYISKLYRRMLMSDTTTKAEKEYIKRKINSAQWLIESIHQRRSTLTRVAQAIVEHQTAFLENGPEAIEPLKMQQIAEKVGVHVTTVSRAVDDKWIQTPRGIFPLRRFFVGGTTSADGEEVAWDAVRIKLREVVDGEDKQKPFSDDELVKELARHGLTVARRTITKYRKAMDIPSSRQRRDWSKPPAAAGSAHPAPSTTMKPDDNGQPEPKSEPKPDPTHRTFG
jgi:RNA polymerase sigma-54 factor